MSRIFSGIQPSGELHIGNYLGAVKNWAELQRSYESFFCIVDYHAITIPYEPEDLRARTREMMVSLLAAGLDPSTSTIFVQSMVPEHTELAWIFNSVTPLGELEMLHLVFAHGHEVGAIKQDVRGLKDGIVQDAGRYTLHP